MNFHLERKEGYQLGITTSGQDGVTKTRDVAPAFNIYETVVFKAVTVRHQCTMILCEMGSKKRCAIILHILLH